MSSHIHENMLYVTFSFLGGIGCILLVVKVLSGEGGNWNIRVDWLYKQAYSQTWS